VKSLSLLKKTITGGFRIGAIAVLSACTTIHPETISQNLRPAEQEKFQRDFAECHEFAESNRPKVSFKDDIAVPLSVAFLFAVVGYSVETKRKMFNDYSLGNQRYDGNALLGFTLAGVVAASWIVVSGMISRQGDQDATLRACLYERGSPVP
jgi:uncharacterized membrane protein YcjF (UPF0283 family)